jgi:hypothetical protein
MEKRVKLEIIGFLEMLIDKSYSNDYKCNEEEFIKGKEKYRQWLKEIKEKKEEYEIKEKIKEKKEEYKIKEKKVIIEEI